jgi:hypothetical protein
MPTIAIDGESKVCATSVGNDIANHFSETYIVAVGDAGQLKQVKRGVYV